MVVFPAVAVMIAVLSFNLLGDAWRDWLDPRIRPQLEVAASRAKATQHMRTFAGHSRSEDLRRRRRRA